jgi:hypothetical protein
MGEETAICEEIENGLLHFRHSLQRVDLKPVIGPYTSSGFLVGQARSRVKPALRDPQRGQGA